MSTKHVTISVLDHHDGGALVRYLGHHLIQAAAMGEGGVEEPPVLPVLQQEVAVQEQDRGVVQAAAVLLNYEKILNIHENRMKNCTMVLW